MSKKATNGARLRSLEIRAKEETDRLWRNWYLEIDKRQKALQDRKQRPFIVSHYEKGGQDLSVARAKSIPTPIKKLLGRDKQKSGSKITQDLLWIREIWPQTVGQAIAVDTAVYAFKSGVLTISVYSSVLLQEIRQFDQDNILSSLRDIWQASVPLLQIKYRMGKR